MFGKSFVTVNGVNSNVLAVRKESTAREYVDYHGVSKYNDGW